MQLNFQMTDDILIACIAGELDHHGAASARSEIDQIYDIFSATHLILDFQDITFMDSSGIGVVMGRYNKVRGKGGKIYITGCSQFVSKILEMAGIFTIVEESGSREDAICRIQGKVPMQMTMEVITNG